MAHEPIRAGVGNGLAGFGLNDAGGKAIGVHHGNEKKIASRIGEQRQHRKPPRHGNKIMSRPAQAVVQCADEVENDGDFLHQEQDNFLRADFFFAQHPARERFAVMPIKVKDEDERDSEVHGKERPTLPVMHCAGNKQQNDQRYLLDESPANQSRQEIFSRLIFQWRKVAMSNCALPATSSLARYRFIDSHQFRCLAIEMIFLIVAEVLALIHGSGHFEQSQTIVVCQLHRARASGGFDTAQTGRGSVDG